MAPRKAQRKDESSRSPFTVCFEEAEVLQQRAERRRGAEAMAAYQQAASKFQQAVQLAQSGGGAPAADIVEAHFGLGESLQCWAEAVLDVCSSLPDAELSPACEAQARSQAVQLFQQSVQAYKQVHTGDPEGGMRVDAAVNCGNTLAAWAEVLAVMPGQSEAAAGALAEAEACYRAALQQEDDALTWNNLADVLVQHAELCCEKLQQQGGGGGGGGGEAAAQLYAQAREAYSRACTLSSSENGDDLPGLLLNWGVALLSMATHAQEPALALQLLAEAAQRLQESISFDRGDVAPHNALGDVLLARAERLAAADPAGAAAAATSALQEGYGGALRINATCPEALVGTAESHVQLARLAADSEVRQRHWSEAAGAYAAALARPEALGKWEERCDTRYNYACCLAQCGRAGEAAGLLRQLQAAGATSGADISGDSDLASVHAAFA